MHLTDDHDAVTGGALWAERTIGEWTPPSGGGSRTANTELLVARPDDPRPRVGDRPAHPAHGQPPADRYPRPDRPQYPGHGDQRGHYPAPPQHGDSGRPHPAQQPYPAREPYAARQPYQPQQQPLPAREPYPEQGHGHEHDEDLRPQRTRRQPPRTRFGALAWSAVILGIVGIVGSPVPILNNLTAIVAGVGLILGVIALFGTKKILAAVGVALCVAAITFTVLAQNALSAEIDRQFGEIGEIGGGPEAMADVTAADCTIVDDGFGFLSAQGTLVITNSAAETQTYSMTVRSCNVLTSPIE